MPAVSTCLGWDEHGVDRVVVARLMHLQVTKRRMYYPGFRENPGRDVQGPGFHFRGPRGRRWRAATPASAEGSTEPSENKWDELARRASYSGEI